MLSPLGLEHREGYQPRLGSSITASPSFTRGPQFEIWVRVPISNDNPSRGGISWKYLPTSTS